MFDVVSEAEGGSKLRIHQTPSASIYQALIIHKDNIQCLTTIQLKVMTAYLNSLR